MKRIILSMVIVGFIFSTQNVYAETLTKTETEFSYSIGYEEGTVQPRADIIEWIYKTENGKVYKRKYNRSTGQWIGDWILVQ